MASASTCAGLCAGPRVTVSVVLSLGVLVAASYAMVLLLDLATA